MSTTIDLRGFGPGLTRVSTIPVAHMDNDELTAVTILRMGELVRADLQDGSFVRDAAHAAMGMLAPDAQGSCQAKLQAVFAWMKQHVQFCEDAEIIYPWWVKGWREAFDKEVLISPERLITMHQPRGDCDDFAMLGMVLLRLVGIESFFVTIKGNPDYPDEWSHVYLAAWCDSAGGLVAFDPSYGQYVGWESGVYFKRKVWAE